MSTELKETAEVIEEIATSARKQVRGFERRSTRAARRINRRINAQRTLHMLNTSFKTIVRVATRFEQASELAPRHAATVKPAARPRARRHVVRQAA